VIARTAIAKNVILFLIKKPPRFIFLLILFSSDALPEESFTEH